MKATFIKIPMTCMSCETKFFTVLGDTSNVNLACKDALWLLKDCFMDCFPWRARCIDQGALLVD